MKATAFRHTATRRSILVVSGLLAIGIASTIFATPGAFYAAYEIEVAGNISLINELKASAGVLFLAGLVMLAGVFMTKLSVAALATGALVYLAYGSSRLLSIAVDGLPHSALVSAAGLEIIIGAICVLVLLPDLKDRQHRKEI